MKKLLAVVALVLAASTAQAGVWFNIISYKTGVQDKSFYMKTEKDCQEVMVHYNKRHENKPYWMSCSLKPLPGADRVIPRGIQR